MGIKDQEVAASNFNVTDTSNAVYESEKDAVGACAMCGNTSVHRGDCATLLRRWQVASREMKSANARQVGGAHYGGSQHQHWDIVIEHDLDYFQGQITKYVMRWKKKNGVEDLKKAQHFLEKYIEEIQSGKITYNSETR